MQQTILNDEEQQNTDKIILRVRSLIMLAIGRASMCWSEIPRGVYDDAKAAKIGDKLVYDIIKIIEDNNEKR